MSHSTNKSYISEFMSKNYNDMTRTERLKKDSLIRCPR